ncbi:MAG: protein-glutamate O-methyltransferase CheR [Bacteriovoracaceae bacterium]
MRDKNEILRFFAKYIESELGIIYVEANYFQLEHRLENIVNILGYQDLNDLYVKSQTGISGQMKSYLLDLATNNETSFFRDGSVFKALSATMIPEIASRQSSGISIWSAASSSGQEAYSIMMEVSELAKKTSIPPVYMLVSDVSETILNRAKEGTYSSLEIQRGLPANLMVEYFEKSENDSWKVKSKLQEHMTFKKINLLESWGSIGPFDIIFVRNVLIYQDVENKKKVIAEMHKRLNPNGYLVLGAAESMFGISNDFKQVASEGAIIYQKV